jgi:hypothetical protein
MKAIGKNINNKIQEYKLNSHNSFSCSYNRLKELIIPNGTEYIYCYNNQLTELNIPNGVKLVYCRNNQLTELNLPNGVEKVYCYNNPIEEITLPLSIKYATLPLNCIVLNLDEFKNRKDITIIFR